jgi:hypothetical protein
MAIETERYVRKPLYVDAVRITEENFWDATVWCNGAIHKIAGDTPVLERHAYIPNECYIRVEVHNPKTTRKTKGFIGDWLLRTEMGFKVYGPKAFEEGFLPTKN